MTTDNRCALCGKSESEHHGFEPVLKMPQGCVCDPGDWMGVSKTTPICAKFNGSYGPHCANCEHDRECHK